MTEHTSDCALNNAPVVCMSREPCSCGASIRFRVFEYDIVYDAFRWRKFSRETLVSEVVGRALAKAYGQQKVVRTSTLIRRAILDGFTPNEATTIRDAWRELWSPRDPGYLDRQGIDDFVSGDDGAYLPEEVRSPLAVEPDFAEIRATMASWLEFWAALPEPILPAVTLHQAAA